MSLRTVELPKLDCLEIILKDTHPDMLYGITRSPNNPSIKIPKHALSDLVGFFKQLRTKK